MVYRPPTVICKQRCILPLSEVRSLFRCNIAFDMRWMIVAASVGNWQVAASLVKNQAKIDPFDSLGIRLIEPI